MNIDPRSTPSPKCFALALALLALPAKAATYTWTPTAAGSYNWNNSGSQNNWTSGFPNAAGDTANLNNNIAGAQTVSLNQPITVGTLNIGDSASSFFPFMLQNGGGSLTLNNNGSHAQIIKANTSTVTDTILASITLADNLTVNVSQPLTISGAIGDGGAGKSLTKSGGGGLTLSGANTFDGPVTISAGTVNIPSIDVVANANPLGQSSAAAANLILTGGTLKFAPAWGGAMTTMTTDRLFSLQTSSTLDASGTAAVNFSNTGNMGFNNNTNAKTLRLTGDNPLSNTIAAVIGDNTGMTSILHVDYGPSAWVLTGANTFTGPVTIQYSSAGTIPGMLVINSIADGGVASALGMSSSSATNLIISQNTYPAGGNTGSTLKYIGGGHNSNRSFTLEKSGQTGGGTIDASGTGALNLYNTATPAYGTVNLARTLLLSGSSTATNSLSALLANNGTGAFALIKAGQGKWVLNGSSANTYTGGTTINTGALVEDFGNMGTPTDLIANTTPITLGGGTLSLLAQTNENSSQTMPSPTFSANAGSGITLNGHGTGTMTLTLGNTWTRNVGSTLNVTLGSGGTLNSSPAVDTSMPTPLVKGSGNIAFATVGGEDWAKVSGGTLVAFAGGDYDTSFPASGSVRTNNYSLTDSGSVTFSETANTLKIATTASSQSLAIAPGQTLTLNAGGLLFVGNHDYSITGGTLAGSGGTQKDLAVHHFGTGNLTIGAVIANNGAATALTKTGPGTLTLTAANTFSGGTYAGGGGTLVLKHQGALTNSALFVNNCSIVFDSSVSGNAFTVNGLNSSYAGPGYNIALTNTAGSAVTLTSNGGGTYNGVLSGPGSLIKNGGGTLTLNGFNTFTGGLTIHAGTVGTGLGNNWAMGPQGNVQVTVNTGGTLSLNRHDITGALTLNGGTLSSGNGFGSTWRGTIVLQADSTLSFGGSSLACPAVISGTGGLTVANVALSATNTFSGNTKISSAALTLQHPLAIQNSILDTTGSAANLLRTTVTALTLGGLSGSRNLNFGSGDMFATSGSGYTNVTALTLNPNASQSPSYSGSIANGAAGMNLMKTGAGTQTLTGANTYSGSTTIENGTLKINGSLGSGAGVTVVGGTLSGVGDISQAVTVNSGGTLKPGDPTGTLSVGGNLTVHAGAKLQYALGASNALVAVTGDLSLAGALDVTDAGGFTTNTYTLFTYTGNLTYSGVVTGSVPNTAYTYDIDTNTANEVRLVVSGAEPPLPPFDRWRSDYFGAGYATDPLAAADADPLGKGMSNTNQFLADLDPTNPVSRLEIVGILHTGAADTRVAWMGGGTGAVQVLEARDGLADGGVWTNLFSCTPPTPAIPSFTNYLDAGSVTQTNRFYRIRAFRP